MKLQLLIRESLRFVLTYAIPFILTCRAIQSNDMDAINISIFRWGLLGLLEFIDPIASPLLSLFPFVSILKFVIYLWVCIPVMSMGEIFYIYVYDPMVVQNSPMDVLNSSYNSFLNATYNRFMSYVNEFKNQSINSPH